MNIPFVDLYAQYQTIKSDIDKAISEIIIQSDYIKGKPVNEFEKRFAEFHGIKHCIGVANGTDALYIALKMLGIGNGDDVITTSLSWISTSETISQTGAKPVFIDIEEDTFTINSSKIEEVITEKTKAIIPVHLYGHCADMEPILNIAKKYNLKIIEDNAQAHFSTYNGQLAGTMGDVSTFSFYPGKNLGAYGDAGAILTNDDALAEKMRMFANHGALVKHNHKIEGINSRLDGIQAAILNVKLNHIHKWTDMRRSKADLYSKYLSDIPEIILPTERAGTKHVYHIYCIKTSYRNELKIFLEEKGISTAIHYPVALPNMEAYKYLNYQASDFPVASKAVEEILSLPLFPEITENEISYIAQMIKQFFSNK